MKRYYRFLLCTHILSLLFVANSIWADSHLHELLLKMPAISGVEQLESDLYKEKYVMYISQDIDPKNPDTGTFKQRLILCHVGFDRPTIMVTEGYFADYALRKDYQDELSKLFNANVIVVEYRYFAKSVPQPCNWDYLTVENSLNDLHHVNQLFRTVYHDKWISTGISKGGQTTMFYRAFFPDDVDVSVPYVAPLNKALEDLCTNRVPRLSQFYKISIPIPIIR